ncbi:acyl- synthetase family member mitochondrial [Labeo rohita]|uniref:Medium-chain acyl-CoA ligase ACSF2, mitochondrial n=1 Tax=Labeo rohita TaxID=84645 RepID=A0A498LPD0_LABRO|nr:acyl- synthetase family member mitochondrial [Labeo rohita]
MSSKILLTNLRTTASFCKTLNFLQRPWTPFIASQQRCAIHVDTPPSIPTLTTSYAHGISSQSLLSNTVDQCLLHTVERHPDREALVFVQDGIRKTFAQFYQDVEQAAAGLLAVGLKKGDRLGMWGPNIYEWVLMQFATAKAGIILVAVNPAYQLQEVEFALRKGTTGKPKGATLSHHNIVNNALFIGMRIGFNWRKNVRVCVPVPMYHCFGSVGGGMVMAIHGTTIVFPSTGYDGHANLVAAEKEKCTFVYGTPTMFIDMLNQPDLPKIDLSSVEGGVVAGSPCPPEVIRKVISVMGIKEVVVCYLAVAGPGVVKQSDVLKGAELKAARQ